MEEHEHKLSRAVFLKPKPENPDRFGPKPTRSGQVLTQKTAGRAKPGPILKVPDRAGFRLRPILFSFDF